MICCALRFCADKNLSDRVYWYESELPLSVGDRVLAPVGVHDKLQLGIVERIEEGHGDRALKRVTAREGDRILWADGVRCVEAGGVRYDEKHYTRFGRALFSKEEPHGREELFSYGVTEFLPASENALGLLARAKGCVLVYGTGAEEALSRLIGILKGEALTGEEDEALRKKFL